MVPAWLLLGCALQSCVYGVVGQAIWEAPPPFSRSLPPTSVDSDDVEPLGSACGEHGKLSPGTRECVCENNFAELPADRTCSDPFFHRNAHGYVGQDCNVEVENAPGEPSVIKGYNLESGEMKCHSVCFGGALRWEHMIFQITRDSEHGDPDLYGKWYYDGLEEREAIPSSPHSRDFSFSELSNGATIAASTEITKSDLSLAMDENIKGVLLCVHSYPVGEDLPPINYTLRWEYSQCPIHYREDGEVYECSTPRNGRSAQKHGECVLGSCQCTDEFKPPSVDWYEGTGFNDCSSSVTTLTSVDSYTLMPDSWRFYEITVGDLDRHVVLDIHWGKPERSGSLSAYLKYGQPPGPAWGEYDKRTPYHYWDAPEDEQIALHETEPEYRSGTWYLGVYSSGRYETNVTVSVSKYTCPMDCSGHGTCHQNGVNKTYECECSDGWLSPPGIGDCSAEAKPMDFAVPETGVMKNSDYLYYTFPRIHPEMAARHVELEVQVQYYSLNVAGWLRWDDEDYVIYDARESPMLLLKSGDETTYPSVDDFEFHQTMQKENKTYVLTIPASKVDEGIWKVAIYNPMRSRSLVYNMTMDVKAYCPNDCNAKVKQGHCTNLGSCMCAPGFTGADCGFLTNQCQVATFERKGHCIKECDCRSTTSAGVPICKYAEQCSACQAPYRFVNSGSSDPCVIDECTEDIAYIDNKYACTKKCVHSENAASVVGECVQGSLKCFSPHVEKDGGCAIPEEVHYPPPSPVEQASHGSSGGLGPGMVTLVAFIMLGVGSGAGAGLLFVWQKKKETGSWDGFLNSQANSDRPWTEMNDDEEFQAARF